jgi:GR25 family glycosyltransferase involved in LPS biosynthesis
LLFHSMVSRRLITRVGGTNGPKEGFNSRIRQEARRTFLISSTTSRISYPLRKVILFRYLHSSRMLMVQHRPAQLHMRSVVSLLMFRSGMLISVSNAVSVLMYVRTLRSEPSHTRMMKLLRLRRAMHLSRSMVLQATSSASRYLYLTVPVAAPAQMSALA